MHESILNKLQPILFFIVVAFLLPGCQREESNKPQVQQPPVQTEEDRNTPIENESAYETVLRELKANPDDIKAIYHLADLYYRDGHYEQAIENYRKVLSKDPERGFVSLRLGTSLSRLQRYEEALEAFEQAIPNLSDPAVVYNNMGITYGKLGRYQDEIDALRNAVKHRPRYASALYNLGVTLLKVDDQEGARKQYEALNEFDLTMAQTLKAEIDRAGSEQNNPTDK